MKQSSSAAVLAVAAFLFAPVLIVMLFLGTGGAKAAASCGVGGTSVAVGNVPAKVGAFSGKQLENAAAIMKAAKDLFSALLLYSATWFFFTALKYLPIADALAIFFVNPLVVTLFSALFLRENVGPRRWAAVAVDWLSVWMPLTARKGWPSSVSTSRPSGSSPQTN